MYVGRYLQYTAYIHICVCVCRKRILCKGKNYEMSKICQTNKKKIRHDIFYHDLCRRSKL